MKKITEGINLRYRNQFQIYVKSKHVPYYREFCRLIQNDREMLKLQPKKDAGLTSIAIMQLIYNYVLERNPKFGEKENESAE